MIRIINIKKVRRLNLTSNYNLKLYKKYLSIKLSLIENIYTQPNLIFLKNKTSSITIFKRIYSRKEVIPLRLLRILLLLKYTTLIKKGIKFIIAKKLSVYNGKSCRFININRGLLDITLRCAFRFGDLIFTRSRFLFKKKKKIKQKKK